MTSMNAAPVVQEQEELTMIRPAMELSKTSFGRLLVGTFPLMASSSSSPSSSSSSSSESTLSWLLKTKVLSKEAQHAMIQDYDTIDDRDRALLTTARCIGSYLQRQVLLQNKLKGDDDTDNDDDATRTTANTATTGTSTTTTTTSEGVYNVHTLQVYDAIVWDFNAPFLWLLPKVHITNLYYECMILNDNNSSSMLERKEQPTPKQQQQQQQKQQCRPATINHCEIAVGTGMFLTELLQQQQQNQQQQAEQAMTNPSSSSWLLPQQTSITLIDLNPNTLNVCERRLVNVMNDTKGGYDDDDDGDGRGNNQRRRRHCPANISIDKVVWDITGPVPSDGVVVVDNNPNNNDEESTDVSFPPKGAPFTTVAANFLLHCLHDKNDDDDNNKNKDECDYSTDACTDNSLRFRRHGQAIATIAEHLVEKDNGIFFGSTVLGSEFEDVINDAARTYDGDHDEDDAAARANHTTTTAAQQQRPSTGYNISAAALETHNLYNEWGVFGNRRDSLESIRSVLEVHFNTVNIWKVGHCAVWKASHPKNHQTKQTKQSKKE